MINEFAYYSNGAIVVVPGGRLRLRDAHREITTNEVKEAIKLRETIAQSGRPQPAR